MKLLCIDPGTNVSGVVLLNTGTNGVIKHYAEIKNQDLLSIIPDFFADHLAIEMIASMGMPVGYETFETCVWIGRFIQSFNAGRGDSFSFIYRKEVAVYLCGDVRANDRNIRRALLDLYPGIGGGKTPQIGIKKAPGPLYGISKHAWAALAVGHTWLLKQNERKLKNVGNRTT